MRGKGCNFIRLFPLGFGLSQMREKTRPIYLLGISQAKLVESISKGFLDAGSIPAISTPPLFRSFGVSTPT